MGKTYTDFFKALGQRESSGNYSAVNQLGYLGMYQFGEAALIDIGFYKADGTTKNDWQDKYWTGKDGIYSKTQFLANHAAQDHAVQLYMEKEFTYIASIRQYDGQTIDGIHLTTSGLLAGAYLVGVGAEMKFLNAGSNGTVPVDGNGTPITQYWSLFSGYSTPFVINHNLAESILGSDGKDELFGYGGVDTINGGKGNDLIHGGAGADILTGGAGADRFYFDDKGDVGDAITDFVGSKTSSVHDFIAISSSAFGINSCSLVVNAASHPVASGKGAQFLYESSTGHVYFDNDGTGSHAAILIATLSNHPTALQAADLLFI